MSNKFKSGDTVRIKSTGRIVEDLDINANPNYAADDEIWAEGYYLDGNGTADINSPDEVERVELKPIPTARQIAEQISSDMHGGWGDVISVSETGLDGATIEAFGRDGQGIGVAFLVTVHEVRRESF